MTKIKYKKKKKKKPAKALILYLVIVLIMSALAFGYKTLNAHLQDKLSRFELADIHLTGNKILSEQEVLKMLGLKNGKKLLEISASEVGKTLKSSPYIRSVSAAYSLPSTLRIKITERKPVAFIYGRGLNMIDRENYILPVPQKNIRWDLPVIRGIKEKLGIQGAETISPLAKKAVEIARYASLVEMPLREMISDLDFSNDDYVAVGLAGCKAVIRIDKENYQEQLFIAARYLKDYLDYEKIDKLNYVDVRFKGQVVIKENKV
jgi:cell division protein FtsQ